LAGIGNWSWKTMAVQPRWPRRPPPHQQHRLNQPLLNQSRLNQHQHLHRPS
jgi:hypothetical protein